MLSNTFWQVFGTAIATAVIILTLFLLIVSNRYEKALADQLKINHDRIAERMSKEIGLFFEHTFLQLRLSSDIIGVLNLPSNKVRTTLNEISLNSPYFIGIQYYDSSFKEIATSDPREPGLDISDNSAVIKATKSGKNWISNVMFNQNRVAYISIAVPTYDLGQFTGVLMAKISLKKIWWWIDEVNTISDTRLSIVESSEGRVIADQLKTRLGTVHPYWSSRDSSMVFSESGSDRFISYFPVPSVSMAVITESAKKTFYSHLVEMRYILIAYAILLVLLSAFFSFYIASQASKKLQTLANSIYLYGQTGKLDLNHRLPHEYKSITDAFSKMADSIEIQRKELLDQENIVAIGRTVASVSHEIRHGMTRIVNLLNYDPADVTEKVKNIENEIFRLSREMDDLLEFSRARQLNLESVSVNDILFNAKQSVRYRKEAEGSEIIMDKMKNPSVILADGNKLSLAISNLIRNSLQAGKSGIVVHIYGSINNGKIKFCVSDNGPGITEKLREKVFEPFFTTKPRGYGIGLSIVSTIAKAHGGYVEIVSNGTNGVEIQICIPTNNTYKELA
jgi:signal transduction histidine kinase